MFGASCSPARRGCDPVYKGSDTVFSYHRWIQAADHRVLIVFMRGVGR